LLVLSVVFRYDEQNGMFAFGKSVKE
jgi:hypothetical protein